MSQKNDAPAELELAGAWTHDTNHQESERIKVNDTAAGTATETQCIIDARFAGGALVVEPTKWADADLVRVEIPGRTIELLPREADALALALTSVARSQRIAAVRGAGGVRVLSGSRYRGRHTVGDLVAVTEAVIRHSGGSGEHHTEARALRDGEACSYGPRHVPDWGFVGLWVDHGPYEVRDVIDEVLVLEPVGDGGSEACHARAVSRLRRLAAADGLAVRVRDQGVEIRTASADVLHAGDIVSAYLWILNLEDVAALPDAGEPARAAVAVGLG
jgi:hypothetical protein